MVNDTGADVGVIGGSGLYRLLDAPRLREIETPFGPPSAPIAVGELAGRRIAFVPRHGVRHEFPPHQVSYRANLWALRSVGVRRILAPSAVGSLQPDLEPGALVVPDQLVDRTSGRVQTFYDDAAVHVPFADPYCQRLRTSLCDTGPTTGAAIVDGGTLVVIEGPRFSTRAESRWFAAQGWSIVGMTGHPEAVLARELALCYAPLAIVTDRDAGATVGDGVDQAEVFATFATSLDAVRRVLAATISSLPAERPDCPCRHALDGMELPFPLPGDAGDR